MIAWFAANKYLTMALAALLLLGVFTETLVLYGDAKYKEGVKTERAANSETLRKAALDVIKAQNALTAMRQQRDNVIHERDSLRTNALNQTHEAIQNAPSQAAAYAAYLNLYNSLRAQSSERNARARADYDASLGIADSGGTRPS